MASKTPIVVVSMVSESPPRSRHAIPSITYTLSCSWPLNSVASHEEEQISQKLRTTVKKGHGIDVKMLRGIEDSGTCLSDWLGDDSGFSVINAVPRIPARYEYSRSCLEHHSVVSLPPPALVSALFFVRESPPSNPGTLMPARPGHPSLPAALSLLLTRRVMTILQPMPLFSHPA